MQMDNCTSCQHTAHPSMCNLSSFFPLVCSNLLIEFNGEKKKNISKVLFTFMQMDNCTACLHAAHPSAICQAFLFVEILTEFNVTWEKALFQVLFTNTNGQFHILYELHLQVQLPFCNLKETVRGNFYFQRLWNRVTAYEGKGHFPCINFLCSCMAKLGWFQPLWLLSLATAASNYWRKTDWCRWACG